MSGCVWVLGCQGVSECVRSVLVCVRMCQGVSGCVSVC